MLCRYQKRLEGEMQMKKVGRWIGGLVVLVGSFLITNWILSNSDSLSWKFTDEASLATEAKLAGFHTATYLAGYVENVVRIDGGLVRAAGWVIDPMGDGSSVVLDLFAKGRNEATFRTDGPRPDITALVMKTNPKASPAAANNTKFTSNFSCDSGERLFVVATTVTKGFVLLLPQPLICP